ncbi:hypothetical protein [Halovivax cerinus]|uniref:Uncharacterized protein n=1 Tax=Halovivax cerinus TaxID=1487865 RepID=A0ABD5NNC7_9EURY|nr:hypothetical protein [Halovivax cerinus]
MDDWSLRDDVGILVVLGMTLGAAQSVDGTAPSLAILVVGAGIAGLWIGKFFLEGYTDAITD